MLLKPIRGRLQSESALAALVISSDIVLEEDSIRFSKCLADVLGSNMQWKWGSRRS